MGIPSILRQVVPLVFLPIAVLSCTVDAPEQADEEAPSAAAAVLPVFDPATFDSIVWPTPRDALARGATVYAYSCAKCHGGGGAGDGRYRVGDRILRPPSFLDADWRLADDVVGIRQAIYSDIGRGKRHWGMDRLAPRDVDAVTRYINWLWSEAG